MTRHNPIRSRLHHVLGAALLLGGASASAASGGLIAAVGDASATNTSAMVLSSTPFAQTFAFAGQSWGTLDAAPNQTLDFTLPAHALVGSLGYSMMLDTVGYSRLNESVLRITNSDGHGVQLSPGFAEAVTGGANYAGTIDLSALGLAFSVLGDGKLRIQLHETVDTYAGIADASLRGSLTFASGSVSPVPEPASAGLMALGLLGTAALLRRRRRG